MAWSSQEKNSAVKLIKEKFLKQFVQSTLNLIGSFEIDAIICLTVGSEQLVIKLHERLKHNHFDQGEIRSNGEPSLLREYLAGSTAVPKPNQPHPGVSRKRKAWDENANAIYSPEDRVRYAGQTTHPTMKTEPNDDHEIGESPLNLSERYREPYQAQENKESPSSGNIGDGLSSEAAGQYSCGLCLLKCNSYASVQDHFVVAHNSNLRYICSLCSAAFADGDAFSKHCAKHSKQNPGVANRRKQTKPRRGVAASEVSDDDVPQNSSSNECKVQGGSENGPCRSLGTPKASAFDQSEGIVRCLLKKRSPLSISCVSERLYAVKHSDPCGASPLDLVTRDAGEAGAAGFRCPHCGVPLRSWGLYSEHCRQIHKRFACNVCLQTFTQRVNRDRHHYNHTGEKPYVCIQCGLGFTRRDALKKHQVRANHEAPSTRGTPKPTSSSMNHQPDPDVSGDSANEDASLPFESLDNLEAVDCQNASHINDDVLSKSLLKNQNLRRSSGSEFEKCTSAFESGSQVEDGELSDEMSVHSFRSGDNGNLLVDFDPANPQSTDADNRPASTGSPRDDILSSFRCDSCQESVIGAAAFQNHCKARHRRTPCVYCGKTFSQKGNMERHMRQHTGERPFHCPFCNSSYTRKETLKTHINQTHSFQMNQKLESL